MLKYKKCGLGILALLIVCTSVNAVKLQKNSSGYLTDRDGTWRFGAKYAQNWTALAPIASGQVTPGGFVHAKVASGDAYLGLRKPYDFDAIKHIPVLVCHGLLDPRAPVENARAMVAKMKELGMTYEYFEKADGTHAMVAPSLEKVFTFFNKHRRIP